MMMKSCVVLLALFASQTFATLIDCNKQSGCPTNGPKGTLTFPDGTTAYQSTDGGDGFLHAVFDPYWSPDGNAQDAFYTSNAAYSLEGLSNNGNYPLATLSFVEDAPFHAYLTTPKGACGDFRLAVVEQQQWYHISGDQYIYKKIKFRNAAPNVNIQCFTPTETSASGDRA